MVVLMILPENQPESESESPFLVSSSPSDTRRAEVKRRAACKPGLAE